MPTYTYRCPNCLNSKDLKHKITEDPEVGCDKCDYSPMDRVISNPRNKVLFKGKGWDGVADYNTH